MAKQDENSWFCITITLVVVQFYFQQRHDRQLAVFAQDFAEEKRKHEQLQDYVKTADGKIQVLEREVEFIDFMN